jgi:cysteine desulfurase
MATSTIPEIYLDNAATTRTDHDLADEMARDMCELFANPSSPHRPGLAAQRKLADARRELESWFGGEHQAIFTASGSEAINLAIKGAFARRKRGRGDRIVHTAVEHHAVVNAARDLVRQGARVDPVRVDAEGRVDLAALEASLRSADDVAIVAVMHVQNELGSVMPLDEVGRLVKRLAPRAFFLVDAVQGLGKLPVDPRAWKADAVALASHKIHGPKGVGCLLLRRGLELEPLVAGGGQEGGFRSGTENVAGIAAFVKATRRALEGLSLNKTMLYDLRERLRTGLEEGLEDVHLNGPAAAENASPAILNVSFRGVPSEVLLHALEQDGIFISAGAACHAKAKATSHVLKAVDMPEWRSDSAVRFGLSWHTKGVEIDRVIERTIARVKELRKLVKA